MTHWNRWTPCPETLAVLAIALGILLVDALVEIPDEQFPILAAIVIAGYAGVRQQLDRSEECACCEEGY